MAITLGYPAFSTPVDLCHVETNLFYIRGRAVPDECWRCSTMVWTADVEVLSECG
jgi:hypothetical protein